MRTIKLSAACLLLALAACAKQETPPPETTAAPAVGPAEDAAAAATAAPQDAAPETGAPETGTLNPGTIELTMPRVERWLAATAKIGGLVEKDPSLEDVTAMDASESIDTYVARLESHPGVAAAIASAGTSPRDYALTSAAVTAAMFAQGMLEAGAIKQLPEGINQQHVDFIREHKDEIAAKMKALEAG